MSIQAERKGKPGASEGEKFFNCSGCLALEAEAPAETPSAEAVQGDEIHQAMESEDFTQLDDEGRTIAEQLTAREQRALEDWQRETGERKVTVLREDRLWIKDRTTRQNVCSAKIDVLYLGSKSALVLDAKTGYLEVTPAFRNIQARIQALAVWHEYPRLEHVRAGINAYRFSGNLTTVDYNLSSLRQVEQQLFWHLWLTEQPHASRNPGPWCRYCRAKSLCPEQAAMSMLPMVYTGPAPMKKADVVALVHSKLTLGQLAFLRERKSMIENFLDAVDARMKGFTPEELASVGYQLVPGSNVRTLPDIQALWNEVHKSGLLNEEEFRACLKAAVGAVEEALVAKILKANDVPKKTALAAAQRIIEPAVKLVPKSPSLKPLKALPE